MDNHSNGRSHEEIREELAKRNQQKEPAVSFKSVAWGRLFGYLKPYRGRMALAILALLISSGFGLAFPLVIVRLLSSVTQSKSVAPLNNLAFLLGGIFLLQAAFSFLQSYLLAYVGEHIVYDLRTSLYNHLQSLSLDFYANRRVGDIVSRLSSDVTQMRTMLTSNFTTLLSQVVSLVGAVVIVLTPECAPDTVHPGVDTGDPAGGFPVRQPDREGQHARAGPTGGFHGGGRGGTAGSAGGEELRAGAIRVATV